jgi:hypothetical protein
VRDGAGGAPAWAGLRSAATGQHGGDGDDCAGDRRGCGSTTVAVAVWLHDGGQHNGRGGQREDCNTGSAAGGVCDGGRGGQRGGVCGGGRGGQRGQHGEAQHGGRQGRGGGGQHGDDGGAGWEDGK